MELNCSEFLGHPHIGRPMQEVRGRRKMVSLCSLITLADIGSLDASGVFRGPFLVSSCQDHSTDHLPAAIASSHERHNKYLIDPHCVIDRI